MGLGLSKHSGAIYPSKKDSSDTGLRAAEAKRRLRRGGDRWKLAETEGQTVYLFIPRVSASSDTPPPLSSPRLPVVHPDTPHTHTSLSFLFFFFIFGVAAAWKSRLIQ